MSIIRQESLFSIQELYEMEPTQRYQVMISAIDEGFIMDDTVAIDATHFEANGTTYGDIQHPLVDQKIGKVVQTSFSC